MDLNTIWFVLIGVLFAGFFLLEGFDYGVGMVSMLATNDDT
ncbi:MAG: cytochrome d ubiquinol oxidase subunit II, partial [Selenomonadaceae bacterium]|nr:cytochrome d ubiquinol oxidase subunit II [Selenomonadaceae bacterium]